MGILSSAFNMACSIHSRAATLTRKGSPDVSTAIKIVPSNYFRFQNGPSETVIHGREFVIPLASMATPLTPAIKRGDKVIDDVYGHMAIDQIIEMPDLGGAIMGYRVRME